MPLAAYNRILCLLCLNAVATDAAPQTTLARPPDGAA